MSIYLHEIVSVVPGREEEYMASVLSLLSIPERRKPGLKYALPVGLFRTAQHSGPWPRVVNLWEHEGWETLTGALSRQFRDQARDEKMEAWWKANTDLRTGGHDRVLLPSETTRDRRGLARDGIRGRVFVHEIVKLPLGESTPFLERLAGIEPAFERIGWLKVGAYRVAWRPREVVLLWALPEWNSIGALEQAATEDSELASWVDYRNQIVQGVEEMILLPGRMNPLSLRD